MSDDLIKRPPDEEFDTMMEVQRNPTGAWIVIQSQADCIEQLERQLDTMQDRLDTANKARADAVSWANIKQAKLAKVAKAYNYLFGQWFIRDLQKVDFLTVLAELEGKE